MNPAIQRLKEENQRKAELQAEAAQHQQLVDGLGKLDQTTVQAFTALIQFMQGNVPKTEVVNQLQSIGTPDAMKVMSAVNDMHSTLKKKNVDLTPVVGVMQSILDQVAQIPKELPDAPEQRESIAVSNLSELVSKFDSLELAIKAVADKEVPAPQVKVDAPEVTVQPTDVQVDVDLKPITKGLQEAVKAFKSIVIPEPEPIDLTQVEKKLDTSNKYLREIADKPIGGGGGGGGHTTPYQDTDGKPTYVDLSNGGVPVADVALATRLDDSNDPVLYVGKAAVGADEASDVWQIAKLDTSSGLIKTWAGSAGFTQVWDNRAGLVYN